jgi:geranylgeranylglycerol-phosphate geranylgeranyltransferase
MITFVCLLAGLAIAIALGGLMVLIASWAVFLLLFYNWKWKRTPLLGNLCVAFTAALAFVYGGAAVQAVEVAIWAAILAFLFHLGREIVKDMEDYPGDKAAAAGTLAVRFGLAAAGSAATVTFLGLVTFLILPWLLGPFDQLYLLVVLAGVLPVLLLTILWLWKWQEPRQLHRLNVLLKADMVVGLAALLVGSPGVKTWFL